MKEPVDGCVELLEDAGVTNQVRVVAEARCRGPLYLTADLGSGHAPLIAIVVVGS
jgi:hypothetical protein